MLMSAFNSLCDVIAYTVQNLICFNVLSTFSTMDSYIDLTVKSLLKPCFACENTR